MVLLLWLLLYYALILWRLKDMLSLIQKNTILNSLITSL